MINIAIDGNEANVTQRVGSNAYAFELLVALEKILQEKADVTVEVLLATPAVEDLPASREGWTYRVFGPTAFWTQWALPWYLFSYRHKYNVLFTPGHYAPRVSAVPYVSSVMDLAYFDFSKQFRKKDLLQLREWTRYSVRHAKRVVAISEFTKQDVVSKYGLPAEKVVVAYPGLRTSSLPTIKEKEKMSTLEKWKISQPYVLYVGTLQPRKNLEKLVEAFELVVEQAKAESKENRKKSSYLTMNTSKAESLQLVIAGKTGWLADSLLHRIQASPLKKRIILTGYVTEMEKHILYRESVASVLIGLYEGFGIPPLEAMLAGTLPIVSNTTSLPEVVGDAGIQVNPLDTKSIATGIKKALFQPAKERAALLKKGRQQMKKFNWETSAQVILDTLLAVAAESARQ